MLRRWETSVSKPPRSVDTPLSEMPGGSAPGRAAEYLPPSALPKKELRVPESAFRDWETFVNRPLASWEVVPSELERTPES